MRYVCPVCGYVYDEAQSDIAWAELASSWKCPLCGAPKDVFGPEVSETGNPAPQEIVYEELKPLTAIEMSALCSNLAKGCEKQFLPEQAQAFGSLAAWFKKESDAAADPSFDALLAKVNEDLESGFPAARAAAEQQGDRGALRALTWSGKVSLMLRSLLSRYAQEGEAMLINTGVYVCTICGFVYVGDTLPEVCPVCKVPNRKFEKIGG